MQVSKRFFYYCVGLLAFFAVASAEANVAANAQILNTAVFNYKDGGTQRSVTANVSLTVGTVLCTPSLINTPANQSTAYTENGVGIGNATQNYTYTFNACGNGPANYTLGTTVGNVTNVPTPPAANAPIAVPSASLVNNVGATVTVSGSTQTTILVPSDGTADSIINGIAANEFVSINGEVQQVLSVSDPGGNGVASIVLVSPLVGAAPSVGSNVLEQVSFDVVVTTGDIISFGNDVTVAVTTSVGNTAGTVTSVATTTTFSSGIATMSKLVRNVTTPIVGTNAAAHTVSGVSNTYYDGGMSGVSGDVLEYVLVIQNTGTGNVTDSTVTDTLPSDLVTAVGGLRVIDIAAASDLPFTVAVGDDIAEYVAPTLIVNVGSGATNAPGLGGIIAPGNTIKVVYRASIR